MAFNFKCILNYFLQLLSQDTKSLAQQFMIKLLRDMLRSEEFVCSIVANENVSCHLLKVLMMKYGYNKILISIVKLMIAQINVKNNLHMTIMNYLNKYGLLYLSFYLNCCILVFNCLFINLI